MPVRYTRPACPPGCPDRTARITATYSSIIASGSNGWIPNLPFITGFPTPRPRVNRPPAAWSSCAAVLAVSTGGRSAAFAIAVPTRTRRVAAATGWHSESASPCPSATATAVNPARSAAAASAPMPAGGSPLCEAIDSPSADPGPGGAGQALMALPSFVIRNPRRRSRLHLLRRGELGPQLALEHLAGGRARQRPGELRGLGALEVGQARPAPGDDLLRRGIRAGLGDDHGVHGLAPGRVRAPHDGHLGHGRVTGEHRLDLGRVDVLAAADD